MATTLIESIVKVRIASGQTTPGATNWQPYTGSTPGIVLDVDTTSGKFTATPAYTTSLGGDTSHWATTGATSIYLPTATGFRVYVRYDNGGPITPAQANTMKWHINWIGMEL
jgi:hypothetical protein